MIVNLALVGIYVTEELTHLVIFFVLANEKNPQAFQRMGFLLIMPYHKTQQLRCSGFLVKVFTTDGCC